jgi:hypothetical protein
LRQRGAKDDAVLNTMGWKSLDQYNHRYAKRTAFETMNEVLPSNTTAKPAQSTEPATAQRDPKLELLDLFRAGKISEDTLKALYPREVPKESEKDRREVQRSYM